MDAFRKLSRSRSSPSPPLSSSTSSSPTQEIPQQIPQQQQLKSKPSRKFSIFSIKGLTIGSNSSKKSDIRLPGQQLVHEQTQRGDMGERERQREREKDGNGMDCVAAELGGHTDLVDNQRQEYRRFVEPQLPGKRYVFRA